MQLEELKLITASNIIKLRTTAGLTQAELGHALNYSDKTISKWERGEAIPDAYVLLRMGEIFGVSVDYLLSSHDSWQAPEKESEGLPSYSADVIIAISVIGVWTVALTSFVVLWLFDIICWKIFVATLPVSILTYMVLICVFKKRKYLQQVIGIFVLSLFVTLYFFVPSSNPWQLFLLAIPAEIIVFLSCNIRKRPIFFRKKKKK
ncbi:MAG: helix-turn-helix transcriptional regulator [Oscillospiraceae bacterium]|nr:helix-turn-helix transcriptional regulator [Oscillospiraceae bacterium]